jgi:hypothetical protein
MPQIEDSLAKADRHVREAEEHVAHQLAIIERLERDQHADAAAMAREVLVTLRRSLALAREHARMERKMRAPGTAAEQGSPPGPAPGSGPA